MIALVDPPDRTTKVRQRPSQRSNAIFETKNLKKSYFDFLHACSVSNQLHFAHFKSEICILWRSRISRSDELFEDTYFT